MGRWMGGWMDGRNGVRLSPTGLFRNIGGMVCMTEHMLILERVVRWGGREHRHNRHCTPGQRGGRAHVVRKAETESDEAVPQPASCLCHCFISK